MSDRVDFLLALLWVFLAATGTILAQGDAAAPSETAASGSLDSALSAFSLWNTSADEFVQTHAPLGFRWLSVAHEAAQCSQKGVKLFGLPVYQTVVRFANDKPVQVTSLFFSRGDVGELQKPDYEALIRKAVNAITNATGAKFIARGKDAANAVKAEGLVWTTTDAVYLLEYSFTREVKSMSIPFRAEFVRLQISPKEKPKGLLAQAQQAGKKSAAFRGVDHIKADNSTGDVAIADIPMVDQGEKGFCVVAATERVLRYYGLRVDENELAQLSNASNVRGTDTATITEVLKSLTSRLKIRVRTLDEINVQGVLALIAEYNRAAKLRKTNVVIVPQGNINVAKVYGEMNPALLREIRGKNRTGISSFERKVKTAVDKGIPVLWSVMLGIVPEEHLNLQRAGGHMRLIIGYNEKSKEIIFSDTWGIGHESKRMPLSDAWTVTTGMATVESL